MLDITKALASLRPGAQWSMQGNEYENIIWHDNTQTKPSKEEVLVEAQKLLDDYVSKQYQRARAEEYPSIANQLDMLWHAINTESLDKTSDFYLTLKAVKDNNPK
jgi:hypothetical protein